MAAIKKIPKALYKRTINYINYSWDLVTIGECIRDNDTVLAIYQVSWIRERTFIIQILDTNKKQEIGIFYEWNKKPNQNFYSCNRLMWLSGKELDVLMTLNISNTNILFGGKK